MNILNDLSLPEGMSFLTTSNEVSALGKALSEAKKKGTIYPSEEGVLLMCNIALKWEDDKNDRELIEEIGEILNRLYALGNKKFAGGQRGYPFVIPAKEDTMVGYAFGVLIFVLKGEWENSSLSDSDKFMCHFLEDVFSKHSQRKLVVSDMVEQTEEISNRVCGSKK